MSDVVSNRIEANLDWEIDDDGEDVSRGVEYEYAIDINNELAVFKDGKIIAMRQNGCMTCAERMAEALECIRLRQIRDDIPERINKYVEGAWTCAGNHY